MNGWLWVILVVAVLSAVLCLSVVRLDCGYIPTRGFAGSVSLWGIRLVRFPSAKPKKPDGRTAKEKPPVSGVIRRQVNEQGVTATVQTVCATVSELTRQAGRLLRHIRIRSLRLELTVGCDDAACSALVYGGVSGAIYTCLGVLNTYTPVPTEQIAVRCDFNGPRLDGDGRVTADIPVFYGLICLIKCVAYIQKKEK